MQFVAEDPQEGFIVLQGYQFSGRFLPGAVVVAAQHDRRHRNTVRHEIVGARLHP